eukprot:jgi/Tetstr1/436606/TSEL_025403.t1
MIRTAFTGPDLSPGEAHPTGHPFLEMIRVLASKALYCHLVLPTIFDDVQARAVAPFAGSRRPDVASGSEPPGDPDAGGSSDTSVANDGSDPRTWSETEAFLRTGVWSDLPREF